MMNITITYSSPDTVPHSEERPTFNATYIASAVWEHCNQNAIGYGDPGYWVDDDDSDFAVEVEGITPEQAAEVDALVDELARS